MISFRSLLPTLVSVHVAEPTVLTMTIFSVGRGLVAEQLDFMLRGAKI
jgi:hypothetical protein